MPVAPKFEDPPTAPNHYPYFYDSQPVAESTYNAVLGDAATPIEFRVRVGDQNLGDTLYVRWASDYPPFTEPVSKLLVEGPDGVGLPYPPASSPSLQTEIRQQEIHIETRCKDFAPAAAGAQVHRLVVIVSDRPFLKVEAFGSFLRYNTVGIGPDRQPVTFPIVAGWNVVCPP